MAHHSRSAVTLLSKHENIVKASGLLSGIGTRLAVELVRLLVANDGLCREMARQGEHHRAREYERRKLEVRSLKSGRISGEAW